jgi:putative transposase
VRSCEALRWAGRVVSSTVHAEADRWTISVLCEVTEEVAAPVPAGAPTTAVVAIDLGLRTFATCSDGRRYETPKPLRRYEKRLTRAARRLSRRQPGSHRRHKARMRVARLHRRIRHIRRSFLHTLSTSIVRDNHTLVVEDLRNRTMLKNHRLARAISDAGWSEFRRQLIYTCQRYRRTLLVAHGFYPSSTRCSQCGNHHPTLTLADRVYDCTVCGNRMDRDLNAAMNVSTLALRGIDARGELSAGITRMSAGPTSSWKRESWRP